MRGREMIFDNLSKKEKGYLFGLFEGDGYKIHDKKSRHYHVEFYLNSIRDKEIINFLMGLLKKLQLNPNIYQDKRYNCKRIRVYSKDFFNIIQKNTKLNKSKDFNIGFVSGMIDSEGYVNNEKSFIMIINTNKEILNECKNFLDRVNINSNISKRKPSGKGIKDSYRMYISVNFKRLNHLSIKVGIPERGGNITNVNH